MLIYFTAKHTPTSWVDSSWIQFNSILVCVFVFFFAKEFGLITTNTRFVQWFQHHGFGHSLVFIKMSFDHTYSNQLRWNNYYVDLWNEPICWSLNYPSCRKASTFRLMMDRHWTKINMCPWRVCIKNMIINTRSDVWSTQIRTNCCSPIWSLLIYLVMLWIYPT